MASGSAQSVSPAAPAPAVNHIGITVPHIHEAIAWYGEVFGFRCIMGPRVLRAASPATAETSAVLGPDFRLAYQAHLLAGDGVGLELFQFLEPSTGAPRPGLGYRTPGPWHVCFTHPDPEAAVRSVVASGGVQHSPVMEFVPGRPWRLVYCADPWGTVLELMSHTYAEVFANWPQPGMQQETEYV
jgi:predicted enzyme related to lactoylglutathione lyase